MFFIFFFICFICFIIFIIINKFIKGKSTQVCAMVAEALTFMPTSTQEDRAMCPTLVCCRQAYNKVKRLPIRRLVVITLPRALAATSLAERLAAEWGCAVGEEIG